MNVQVLVSTMNQKDKGLLSKMNIQSDVIIINQTDYNNFDEFEYKGNNVKIFSMNEKGVGLSRNHALMRANKKISLLADDDVEYVENYPKIIEAEFDRYPQADIIIFNVESKNDDRPSKLNHQSKRLRIYNSLSYGTFRIAYRTEKIRKANISFSLLFGGGACFSSGEDTLFIIESLKKGLKIYASNKNIAYVSHEESTWFSGYTDKYFTDKGYLFANGFPNTKYLIGFIFAIKWRNISEKSFLEILKLIINGAKNFKEVNVLK